MVTGIDMVDGPILQNTIVFPSLIGVISPVWLTCAIVVSADDHFTSCPGIPESDDVKLMTIKFE